MRSVVIATCEGERYINEQLDSILEQLAPDDEVVVSDDASTDGTLDAVNQRQDPRIRVLAHCNRVGYVANFQRAIEASRGESIFFSDQDDVWLPNKVASLDAALLNSRCVASDAVVVDEALRPLHHSYFESVGTRGFSSLSIYYKPKIIGATMACRREYLRTLLPFPAGIPHDYWLTLNAAHDGALAVLRTPTILYRRHATAFSVTGTGRKHGFRKIATERARLMGAMLRRRLLQRPRVKLKP